MNASGLRATKLIQATECLPSAVAHPLEAAWPRMSEGWDRLMQDETAKPYFQQLTRFVAHERRACEVYPSQANVFRAFELTPYESVRVVLLGQDPYHGEGQAHGLCFSVPPGIAPPPSLVNIFKELQSDLGFDVPAHGCLVRWAQQGVLLLNTVLTVRAHQPNSHKNKGWELFTDAVLSRVNERPDPVVFVLWGGHAQKKAKLVDPSRHTVLQAAHPSPLSAHQGFFGSKCFSKINDALCRVGKVPIDWALSSSTVY